MTDLLKLTQPDPVDWCERNIQLDYGKFDAAKHPLMSEPLRSAANMRAGMTGPDWFSSARQNAVRSVASIIYGADHAEPAGALRLN